MAAATPDDDVSILKLNEKLPVDTPDTVSQMKKENETRE